MSERWTKWAYISSPLRAPDAIHGAYTPVAICRNTTHAWALACIAWQAGWATLCPHKNTESMDGLDGVPPEAFIQADVRWIGRMVPDQETVIFGLGWQESAGCQEEHEAAVERGLLITHEDAFGCDAMRLLDYLEHLRDDPSIAAQVLTEEQRYRYAEAHSDD